MLAMANGHLATVEMLIVHGSYLEAVDKWKRTALFRGAAFGRESCVQALLDQNVSPTKRDINGMIRTSRARLHLQTCNGESGLSQKYAFIKKSTIFTLSLRNLVKIMYS